MASDEKQGHSPARLVATALAVAVAILGAAYLAFGRVFVRPPAEVPVMTAPPPVSLERPAADAGAQRASAAEEAVVVGFEGTVERARGDGPWKPVQVGETLRAEDSLRTSAKSKADLQVGERSRLTVSDETHITVRDLSAAVHRLKLTRGRITAAYEPDGERVLRIEDETGTAVAESRGARFSVLSTGQTLAVATETGVVNLKAADKVVEVSSGQQAVALRGQAPSAATPISPELLLKVARAAQPGSSGLCATLDGAASAGSQVTVDGLEVPVQADGRFHSAVASRPGLKAVRVVMRDASGKTSESQVPCLAGAVAPPLKLKLSWKSAPDAG